MISSPGLNYTMCIYTYVDETYNIVYTYMCKHIHKHTHINICTCMCTCVHIYAYVCTHVHTYTYIYIYVHTHINIYVYTCMYMCMCISKGCLKFQEMSKSLSHIYFYYFCHIISGVGLWSVKCVSKCVPFCLSKLMWVCYEHGVCASLGCPFTA